jgi:hypothetical protein
MTYVVIIVTTKLNHYSQSYPTTISTSYSSGDIGEQRIFGENRQMGYSLSQYAMDFTARTSIKSQVLAYFIADWAPNVNEEENEERRKKTMEDVL